MLPWSLIVPSTVPPLRCLYSATDRRRDHDGVHEKGEEPALLPTQPALEGGREESFVLGPLGGAALPTSKAFATVALVFVIQRYGRL